jgi:PST family polysaccharide transporter
MALSSAFWTTLSGLTQQGVLFAVQIILARLLLPRDFGLVAMLLVFSNFATLFVDFGLAAALIQRRDVEERHRSSVFWLNLAVGVAMAVLMAILAPLIALFYGQPRLLPIAIVLGLDFILASTAVVQTALLQRDLRFRRLAGADNVSVIFSGVLAVAAAA